MLQLVKRTIEEYMPIAQDHELQFFVNGQPVSIDENEQETQEQKPVRIQGDEERLEQVLVNLLSNAVKYSPNSGPVMVSLRNIDKGTIEIAVQDKGIGVPLEEQERLTERFFRARNAQSIDIKGLGLGLYLVNTLVAKHGGTLSIASEGIPGKGSTFTVTLPTQK
jgi:signal transduction histidine kinase